MQPKLKVCPVMKYYQTEYSTIQCNGMQLKFNSAVYHAIRCHKIKFHKKKKTTETNSIMSTCVAAAASAPLMQLKFNIKMDKGPPISWNSKSSFKRAL